MDLFFITPSILDYSIR